MKTTIIYHSYSGNTRSVAEKVQAACGGDLVEVKLTSDYSRLTAYTLGCYRAMKGMCDPIEQKAIDIAAADVNRFITFDRNSPMVTYNEVLFLHACQDASHRAGT